MKQIIIGCLSLLSLSAAAQQPFTITGKIGKLDKPAMAYFSYGEGTPKEDSCALVNGVFTFKGNVNDLTLGRISLRHTEDRGRAAGSDYISLILDGNIRITGTESLQTAQVKGSQLVNDYAMVQQQKDVFSAKVLKVWNDFHALPANQRDDKAFGEAYGKVMTEDRNGKFNIDLQYALKHPASKLSPLLIVWHVNGMPLDSVELIYNKFTAPVKATEVARVIAKKIAERKAINVGGIAPNFTIPDTEGKPVSLTDYKGKYVLVDFWASWCKPCRAENPNVIKAFNAYKDKNFTVLSVSIDDSVAKDKWLKAIEDDGIGKWTNVCELKGRASQISNLYHIESIPMNVLIDPSGKIVARNLRGEALQEKLANVLH